MSIYIMIAILLTNIIAIAIVYQFIKKLEKKEKIIFLAVCIAIIYILISIVYWFSGFGIDEKIHNESKTFITYMFVPVNVILFIPYIALNYMKLKDKKIQKEIFIKKCILVSLIAIVVLIGQYFYFKNVQQNISKMSTQIQNTNQNVENEITENINVNEQEEQSLNQITNEQR